jgi:hypothetical protein
MVERTLETANADQMKTNNQKYNPTKTIKTILKEAGFAGLTKKQAMLAIWFSLSPFGLTMNGDAPLWAWLIIAANLITSGLLYWKYVRIMPYE